MDGILIYGASDDLVEVTGCGRVRVNRDCLRDMLHPGCYGRPATEGAVTLAAYAAARQFLAAGLDVIADDTNLRPEVVEGWRRMAADVGAAVVLVDLTDVPVEECVRRDGLRPDRGYPPERWDGARTGDRVIRDMAGRYLGVDGMVSA
jgi:chloramphenicol 3-O-phosphotransferase